MTHSALTYVVAKHRGMEHSAMNHFAGALAPGLIAALYCKCIVLAIMMTPATVHILIALFWPTFRSSKKTFPDLGYDRNVWHLGCPREVDLPQIQHPRWRRTNGLGLGRSVPRPVRCVHAFLQNVLAAGRPGQKTRIDGSAFVRFSNSNVNKIVRIVRFV